MTSQNPSPTLAVDLARRLFPGILATWAQNRSCVHQRTTTSHRNITGPVGLAVHRSCHTSTSHARFPHLSFALICQRKYRSRDQTGKDGFTGRIHYLSPLRGCALTEPTNSWTHEVSNSGQLINYFINL